MPSSPREEPGTRSADRPGGDRETVALIDGGYPTYGLTRRVLEKRGYRLRVAPEDQEDRSEKRRFAGEAEGLFVRWSEIDESFLAGLRRCRALVRYGTGYDNVDLEAATRRGIAVSNVSGYARHSVSDHAIGLLTACVRRFPAAADWDEEAFLRPPSYDVSELHTLTVGIVGFGDIGSAFGRKVRPLVDRVLAHDPYVASARFEEVGVRSVELETLFERSDVVSVHCALTDETRGLVDRPHLDRLGTGSVLLNTARGEVIDEEAVLEALRSGRLAGCGLDVYGEEPPTDRYRALIEREDVMATPHYAWYSEQSLESLHRRAGANMADLLDGDPPEDCLNPEIFGR